MFLKNRVHAVLFLFFLLIPFFTWSQTEPMPEKKQVELKMTGTASDLMKILPIFVQQGADYSGLTSQFRPTDADYEAFFIKEKAPLALKAYKEKWSKNAMLIKPGEGQTSIHMGSATTEQLKNASPESKNLPEPYTNIVSQLQPGLEIFAFRFTKPKELTGTTYDGLVFVNGHWAIFPEPWKILEGK